MTISMPPLSPERETGLRAPTQAEWDAMTPVERARAAAALPATVPNEELGTMDGQRHQRARDGFEGALLAHSASTERPMFVGGLLAVYFPGERRIQPDVFVVLGAEQAPRDSWVVSKEGRAPEFVLEILVLGHREKDLLDNVTRYAQRGIREYFVADFRQRRLRAWRLADPAIRIYTPIVPQLGRFHSTVLGLDLKLEGGRVRLYYGNAPLLEPDEIAERLRDDLNDEQMRHQDTLERAADAEAAQQAAEAAQQAAEAAQQAAEAAQQAAEAAQQAAEAAQQAAEAARQVAEERAHAEAKARVDAEAELARLRELVARMKPA